MQTSLTATHRVVMEFKPDPRSGTPKLHLIKPRVTTQINLQPWNDELSKQYEELSTGKSAKIFRFRKRIADLPLEYDVQPQPTLVQGMPMLLLTSRESGSVDIGGERLDQAYADGSASWRPKPGPSPPVHAARPSLTNSAAIGQLGHEFVNTLRAFLHEMPQSESQQVGIRTVLKEMSDLVERHPQDWLLLMLSGFLQLTCRFGSGTRRELDFLEASHLIDEICSVLADHHQAESDLHDPPRLFIRNATRLLKTLCDP